MENPVRPLEAVIEDIKQQTYDTVTYRISFKDLGQQGSFAFKPGQFNMVTLFGIGEAPISLSSEPQRRESFDHTVRAVGSLTKALTRLEPGSTVGVRGPYGSAWPMEEAKGKNVLIVAGGIGLAPLRPAITYMFHKRADFGSIEILYGARTPEDMLFTDEFDDWEEQSDARVLLTADTVPQANGWKHNVGVVTTLFDKMRTSPEHSIVLTCGPEIMMRFVVIDLLRRRFAPDQIFVSLERRMKCGVAMCGHCQVGPKYVCKDGPVFRYSALKRIPVPVL